MDCPLNKKRFLIGGLTAGVWVLICESITHMGILGDRYMALAKMGLTLEKPSYNFCPVFVATSLVSGLALAWIYAAARGTFKPGACTAVKVGFVVWLIAALPGNLAALAWSPVGKFVPFVTTVALFVECIGGALIAGAIYKPKTQST